MKNPLFSQWKNPENMLSWVVLIATTVWSVFFVWGWLAGPQVAISWETVSQMDSIKTTVASFSKYMFNYPIEADSFFVFEQFFGSEIKIPMALCYGLLVTMLIFNVVGWVSSTYFKNYAFYIALTVMALYLLGLRLESLMAFGFLGQYVPTVVIFSFALLAYMIHSFWYNMYFVQRIYAFVGLSLVWVSVLGFGATVAQPILHVVHFGYFGMAILTFVFIFWTAYEILYFFLFLITSTKNARGTSGAWNFFVVSLLVLGNVALTYYHNRKMLDWDMIYVHAFFLYLLGTVGAIWTSKYKFRVYQYWVEYLPVANLVLYALAMLSTATISYAFWTANDSAIEMFEDSVIYSQLALGFLFVVYVFVLFLDEFKKNLPVFETIFLKFKTRFFLVHLGGIVATVALVNLANLYPLYQGIAGYFASIGDVYRLENDAFLAEQYYKQANHYEFYNHKANYSLGKMAETIGDKELSMFYYKQAIRVKPTPYAFANLSFQYAQSDIFFDALEAIKDGNSKFPTQGELQNNLGLLFNKTDIKDSVIYYLEKSRKSGTSKTSVPMTNILGFLAQNKIAINDSILSAKESTNDISYLTNKLCLMSLIQQKAGLPLEKSWIQDSILSAPSVAYLNNFIYNQIDNADTSDIGVLRKHLASGLNSSNQDVLQLMLANRLYYSQLSPIEGIKSVDILKNAGGSLMPYYANLLGLWLFENGIEKSALDNFNEAATKLYLPSAINKATAASRVLGSAQALEHWKEQITVIDTNNRPMIQDFTQILSVKDPAICLKWDDRMKVLFVLFRSKFITTQAMESLVLSISDEELKSQGYIALINTLLANNQWERAKEYIDKANNLQKMYVMTENDFHFLEMRYYFLVKDHIMLQKSLNLEVNPSDKAKLSYFKGFLAERAGKPSEALALYRKALQTAPFFEEGVVAAISHLNAQKKYDEAYTRLLEIKDIYRESVPLTKAYILQSIRINIESYATTALQKLKTMVSETEYQDFVLVYEKEKQQSINNVAW